MTTKEYPYLTDISILKFLPTVIGHVTIIDWDKIFYKYPEIWDKYDKILLVTGDSFTHGDELADTEIEDFPGYLSSKPAMTIEDREHIVISRKWFIERSKKRAQDEKHDDLFWAKERLCSYPALIQKARPDILVISFAKGGSSIYRNTRLLIEACLFLKQNTDKEIEVILGLSGHQRTEEIMKYGYCNFISPEISINGNYSKEFQGYMELYSELYLNYYSDDVLIEKWYTQYLNFCSCMNTLDIKFQVTIPSLVEHWLNKNENHEKIYEKYKYLLDKFYKPIVLLTYTEEIRNFDHRKIIMPGGHYAPEIHGFVTSKLLPVVFNG